MSEVRRGLGGEAFAECLSEWNAVVGRCEI